MKRKILYILFVSLILFTSCKPVQPISMSGVNDFKIEEASLVRIKLSAGIKIKNPNAFGFKIYPSVLNFKVNGIDMGAGRITKRTKIKANSEEAKTFF